MSGLTVAPAAALLAIYSALLVYAIALSVLLPPLRRTRIILCVYLAIRLFSFAVWLSSALGNSLSTPLYNASFSLFYAGFFLLVGASYPLFYAWLAQVAAAAVGVATAPLVAVTKYSRIASYAGVILLIVSGSQLATASIGNSSVAWSGPVGIVGAALLLTVTLVALPFVLIKASPPLAAARSAALDEARRAELTRLLAAAAVLGFICLCTSIRGAGAVATAAGETLTQASLYGLVVGPELPAALALIAPIDGLFAPPPPPAAKSIELPPSVLPAPQQPAPLAPAVMVVQV